MTSYVKKIIGGIKTYFSPPSASSENNHSNSNSSWDRSGRGFGKTTVNSSAFTFHNSRKRRAPTFEEPYSPELTDDEDLSGDSHSNAINNRVGYPAKKPKYSPGVLSVGAHNSIYSFGSTLTPYNTNKQNSLNFDVLQSGPTRVPRMGTRGMNSENRNTNSKNLVTKPNLKPMSIFGATSGVSTLSSLGQQNHKKSNFGQLKGTSLLFPTSISTSNSQSRYPVKTSNGGTMLGYPILETARRNSQGIEEVTLDGDDDDKSTRGQNKTSTYKLDRGTPKTFGNRFGMKTPAKFQGMSGGSCSSSYWNKLFPSGQVNHAKEAAKLKEKEKYVSMVEQMQKNQFAECARRPWISDVVGQRASRLNNICGTTKPDYSTAFATIAKLPVLRKDKGEKISPLTRTLEDHERVKELYKTFDNSSSDDESEETRHSKSNKILQRKSTPYVHSNDKVVKDGLRLYSVPPCLNESRTSRSRGYAHTPRPDNSRGHGRSRPLHPGVTVRSRSTQWEKDTEVISLTSPEDAAPVIELGSDTSFGLSSRLNIGEMKTPKNEDKAEESDDDIKILAESIISPASRRSSIQINSLELETRQLQITNKSWLQEGSSRFKADEQRRRDQVRKEYKTIEIIHTESDLTKDRDKRIRNNLTLTEIILLEPVKPELPEITEEMQLDIERVLGYGNLNEVMANAFNIQITRGDLKTLAPCQWLNDNVINTYMDMIAERSRNEKGKYPSIHVFTTFFYPKFLKEGYSNVLKRWTRKVDIFSFDLLIFPIHLGIHWCLAVADLRHQTINYYDSLLGNQTMCVNALLKYLSFEMRERKKTELKSSEWKLELVKTIPTQQNGSDCGVFTCKFAEYLSRDADLTFKPENMIYYRHRMIYEIMRQDLLFP